MSGKDKIVTLNNFTEKVDNVEKRYKQTILGEIPVEWELLNLKDVGSFQYGYTTSAIEENNGIKFLRITDISENGSIDWEKVPYCLVNEKDYHKYQLYGGDLVFARIGATSGKTGYIDQDTNGIFASYLIRFKTKDSINSKFIFYFTQSIYYWSQALRQREGQLKKGMNANTISRLKIPVPPLPEQEKIAKILSIVDQALHKSDEIINKTKRLKKGIMQELLTKGIGHEEFKKTKIGKIPVDWEIVELGNRNIITLIMGQSPPSSTYNKESKGLPFLQGKAEFGDIHPSPVLYCSKPQKIAEQNDILISIRAPVGDVNISQTKYCIGRGLASIRAKKDMINYLFIFYYLKSSENKFESLSMGSTFKAIRKGEIEKFTIPLPPLPEQEKIAEILSNIDKKLEFENKRKLKLERIKIGLMNDLLTGKKRVNVCS